MSKDQQFDDLKYEDAKETIEAILSRKTLPVVVRVVDDGVKNKNMHICAEKVPLDKEIFLDCKMKIKYAHVKVLNYHDNEVREREMGPEFVLEHDSYVGEDFLIPAKYGGEIKLIRRPRCRGRYATVSEIIEELPRYVKVQEDFKALPVDEKTLRKQIQKQTTLEILQVTSSPRTNKKQLIVSDGHEKYSLDETEHVNVTEVEDDKPYHLHDLVRYKMLPKVIKFAAEAGHDVISYSYQNNTIDMAIVDGPLELIGFVDLEVIVGWIRDKSLKTYTTILIPRDMWKSATVQERALYTVDDKTQYIRRKYGHCQNIQFVENGLYTRIIDAYNVVYLRSPAFYTRTDSVFTLFDVTEIQFEDSSDDEICDSSDTKESVYEYIVEEAPSIPKRIPLMPQVKKKKTMFAKVHEELLSLKSKLKKIHDTTDTTDGTSPPSRPPKSKKVQRSASNLPTSSKVIGIQRSVSHMDECTRPEKKITSRNNSHRTASFCYNKTGGQACAPRNLNRRRSEEYDSDPYDYPDIVDITKRPLPDIPSEIPNNESSSSIKKEEQFKQKPTYFTIMTEDTTAMLSGQNTGVDFYNYSVIDCSHCFHYCGLEEFAETCLKSKLDGAFFKNFDIKILKEKPFCLDDLNVDKVKQIIAGWRPKIG
ncbi:hypothetical protein ACF0H5_004898 [Mactra antiquata]